MIGPDEAHIWWAGLDVPAPLGAGLAGLLSKDERRRAERLVIPSARERFTVARALLRVILAQYTGTEAAGLAFAYGPHGKPELREGSREISFSLSHAGDLLVVAVAGGCALGVDIEPMRPLDDLGAMARLVCSPRELEALDGLPQARRAEAFLSLWTLKEAYGKARGTGLAGVGRDDLASVTGWSVERLAAPAGYVGAIAAARAGLRHVHRKLAEQDLVL